MPQATSPLVVAGSPPATSLGTRRSRTLTSPRAPATGECDALESR